MQRLGEKLNEGGWTKKRGVQRTDSTHVLAALRCLTHLDGWVRQEGFEYERRRIKGWCRPGARDKEEAVMEQIGRTGWLASLERIVE